MLTGVYICMITLCGFIIVGCSMAIRKGHKEWWFVVLLAVAAMSAVIYLIYVIEFCTLCPIPGLR